MTLFDMLAEEPEQPTGEEDDARLVAVATLGRALLNVTLIQVLGYMMKKYKLLPETALPGAGAFIGLVSLPCIYFRAVATLDFATVKLEVLISLVVGKLLLMALSTKLGGMTRLKEAGAGDGEMRGGVFALLTTNSDDLGLGLPVMGALFPASIVKMCFVLNATQAMVFNPQIFMLFGIGAAKRDAERAGAEPAPMRALVLSVLRGQCKNFLNIAVVSGLVWNVALGRGRGCALPFFVENLLVVLGAAFGPVVLFLGGAANVGAFTQLLALRSVVMPLLTVLLKVLVLPTFVTALTGWLGAPRETVDFAFAFSTLPSAASTLVFAAPYKPSADMASLMSASLLLHKVVGFPVLFLAAATFTTSDAHEVVAVEAAVAFDTQALCVGLVGVLLLSRTWYSGWNVAPLRPLYGLLVLTAGYYAASIAGGVLLGTNDIGDDDPPPPGWAPPALLFAVTSFFRWASDATVVVCACVTVLETRARLRQAHNVKTAEASAGQGQGQHPGKRAAELAAPLMGAVGVKRAPIRAGGALEMGISALVGVAMTAPWLLLGQYPPQTELDTLLPLWVPYAYGYDMSQPLVYAVAYALGAATLLVCAGVIISADAHATELIGGRRSIRLLRLRRTHSFLVRFEAFLFVTATRMALSAAICAGLCVKGKEGGGAELTGSLAIMLLVSSLLANSSGLVLFFLFGMSEGIFRAPAAALQALVRRAAAADGWEGAAAVDAKDAAEKAGAGSGYDDAPTARALQKEEASATIGAAYRRRASLKAAAASPKGPGFASPFNTNFASPFKFGTPSKA